MSDTSPRAPESIIEQSLDTGAFPTEAWEFTKPGDATPTLTLKPEWKLAATDVDILDDLTVAGDATIAGSLTARYGTLGHFHGLTLSNNAGDATNDIDIAAGEAVDNADGHLMVASALTKRLDAAWAVGTNQGGLFSGSIANTTYRVFLIKRTDTGVVDAGFSTSATASDIPANYTKYRHIGYIERAGGTILAFDQRDDRFVLRALINDRAYAVIPATSRQTQTLSVPPNTIALVNYVIYGAGGSMWIRPTTFTDAVASATNRTDSSDVSNGVYSRMDQIEVDASSQISYRGTTTSIIFQIETAGWIDTRGRLA